MPEATIICCDCSEYMRNGDFHPTRFDAQNDSVSLITNTKTQQNIENTVGLIAMNGKGKADVLVNCTTDVGRVLTSCNKMMINGYADILVALKTAKLALKHRKNKKQDQRILLFVGSPIKCNEKQLIKTAKTLKKNKVAVDVVSFGEIDDNKEILEKFHKSVNSNDNSALVVVEAGKLLSDVLVGTSVFNQDQQINEFAGLGTDTGNSNAGGGGVNNAFAEYGGIDPSEDPEMAMAIKMSLDAERQRKEQLAKENKDNNDNNNDNNNNDSNKADNNDTSTNNDNNNSNDNSGDLIDGINKQALIEFANEMDMDPDDPDVLAAYKMSLEPDNDDDIDINDDNNKNNDDDQEMMDELLNELPGIKADDIDMNELLNNDYDDENENNNNNDSNNNDKNTKDNQSKPNNGQ